MERRLILRTVDKDMKSYGGFTWPKSGYVEAPDWEPTNRCGKGLHGFLFGEGDGSLADWSDSAKWLVAEIIGEHIDLEGKVKFPAANVLFCGTRLDATKFLSQNGAEGKVIIGGTATAGDRGTATAGVRGTATAGAGGTATAGVRGTATAGAGGTATAGVGGTATAGVEGTATAGDGGTATAGVGGTATAGDYGAATAGCYGTATAGVRGTATAGDEGTATAGDEGTATAGDEGTATAGAGGTATAGDYGVISLKWWDGTRCRLSIGYVGEDGIKPNTKYRTGENGILVEAG